MPSRGFALCLALALVCLPTVPIARQDTAPLSDAAMEQFLRTAKIVRTRDAGKGVTGSARATLSDGTLTHDAHIQTIDQWKREFTGGKTVEFNFRDSWKFNVAVYKIDRLLGLRLVPVSVERGLRGDRAAFTWWVDDVLMDEGERLKKDMPAPDGGCWNEQIRLVRVLDQLVDNVDRNLGNMLITRNWRVWAIDHTRAFRYSKTPRNPAILTAIDRAVLERLAALEFAGLKRDIGAYISEADIRILLARRDGIVSHFKTRGDSALYDRRTASSGCHNP